MEISTLQAAQLESFVDDLWLPAQHEMAAASEYTIAGDIRDDGLSHRRSRLPEDDTVTYLARSEDHLLGYVAAEVTTPPPIFRQVRECHVNELYVREDARRQGVATELLGWVEKWGANRDCKWIELNVDATNRSAIALYEANGYEVARHSMQKPVGNDT